MAHEKTLLLIKPDSVQKGLIGRILNRYEEKGFEIAAMKLLWMTRKMAEELYKPHVGKSFFEPTVRWMSSFPIVAVVIAGNDAINQVRKINGATNPLEAMQGTIRGDFGLEISSNCVHGSDTPENAQREIAIFFKENEILSYSRKGVLETVEA